MPDANSISRGRRLALASVLIIIIGSIGPWVDAGGQTAGGLDKDGVVTIFFALVAAVYLIFTRLPHWLPTAILGFIVGAIGIFDIVDIEDLNAGFTGGFVSPGWGLYLTAIGGIALIASAAFAMRTGEEAGAPIGILGFVIIGACALLLVVAVISTFTQEEVARTTVPDAPPPLEIEP